MKLRPPNSKRVLFLTTVVAIGFLSLLGCKKSDPILGTWQGGKGSFITFKPDRTFVSRLGQKPLVGTWVLAGSNLSITREKIGTLPYEALVDDQIDRLRKKYPELDTPEFKEQMKAEANKPVMYKLSEDGKTLIYTGNLPGGTLIGAPNLKKEPDQ